MEYTNQPGHCGSPRQIGNYVTTIPYDPSCPDQCARVIPFNGQGRAIQPGESNCKVLLTLDNSGGSSTRYAYIGPGSLTQSEAIFNEFLEEGAFELPSGVDADDFFNFDVDTDTANTLNKLNAILTFRLYENSRIIIKTTGSEAIQEAQFIQELQQLIIGNDPFDYCPAMIGGLSCSACPDNQQVQVYDKCEIYFGKHTSLLVPVVAGAIVRFEACTCGYTLVENLTACGTPRFAKTPLPVLPFCPEVVVPVNGTQQYSNGQMVNGQFVPNGNGAAAFNANGNGNR